MSLWNIALRNVSRRKGKVALLVLTLAFGVATIVTLVTMSLSMEKGIADHFSGIGSKILIKPKMEKVTFTYGPIVVASGVSYDVRELTEDFIRTIEKIDEIELEAISPKLLVYSEINGVSALLVGVDIEQEMNIKKYWSIIGSLPYNRNEILIGSKVAKSQALSIGDSVIVEGTALQVVGMLEETGSEEDGLFFMDLATLQELFHKQNQLSFVEVNLTATTTNVQIAQWMQSVSAQLPDVDMVVVKGAIDSRKELIERFSSFSSVMTIVVTLIGALIVTAAMMSSVNERTREIGILRAIGYREVHISKIIMIEALAISLFSAFLGYGAGMLFAVQITPFVTGLELAIVWNSTVLMISLLGTIGLGLVGSVYPAFKASKLHPANALRHI